MSDQTPGGRGTRAAWTAAWAVAWAAGPDGARAGAGAAAPGPAAGQAAARKGATTGRRIAPAKTRLFIAELYPSLLQPAGAGAAGGGDRGPPVGWGVDER